MEHAELCKIIDNTYRDVVFAYANQMAMICEQLGLNFHAIREAANQGYPRNNIARPSPGVGGPCLTKDPYILIDLCQKQGIDTALIQAGRTINQQSVFWLAQKITARLNALGRNPFASKVFIMGFAFKGEPQTSDIRSSTTLDLVEHLKPFCPRLYGYDAVVDPDQIASLGVTPVSIEAGFDQADAVIIMNAHQTHKNLDIAGLSRQANQPVILVDCWNLYNRQQVEQDGGVIYCGVGLY